MPSVRYYNQTAPFWDFVASLEEQGRTRRAEENVDNEQENEQPNPWTSGWAGFPWGPFPHRGHHAPPPPQHSHSEGPPPPPAQEGEEAPEAGPSDPRGPPPPFSESPEGGSRHSRHGYHDHGPHRGPGARGGPCGRGGRAWGRGRGHFHPYAGMGPFGAWANMFPENLLGEQNNDKNEDYMPDADVFDTPEAFVVHVSLPGAKKEDVSVNWDAEKSELSIAGVNYRPGDEEFLKTLALDERKVGPFERKLRLGSRANPAQVDVDSITARLEDGILRIEVPKLDSGYVEIKKVDIE
ncbi:hypothetical protein AC579_1259 [Pseudocercospora musae]|uniref:SHSP domain-containing protein n=1 Tax=Pseudocercospora musae TaxID=113226 RepID=A0A139I7G6_9PEZI|nr:hypothetical protein AC579_1259 [Pseudocercospora musae]